MNLLRYIRDFLIRILPFGPSIFGMEKRDTAWIVHARSIEDFKGKMPFIASLPSFASYFAILLAYPYIISEFKYSNNREGYVVAVPLLPIHFANNKFISLLKTKQAIKLAKKLGAKKISVGGFLPSVVDRGNLAKKFKTEIFDGTDLLASLAMDKINSFLQNFSENNICSIGIIGATTKVGSKITKLILNKKIKLNLFAKTLKNIEKLKDECLNNHPRAEISIYTNLDSVKNCDIVILTAYLPNEGEPIVQNLKNNSIFFSVIEPVSPFVDTIKEKRPDVTLHKGIFIKAPEVSYKDFDSVVETGNAYVCLTEALVVDDKAVKESRKELKETDSAKDLLEKNNFKMV